MGEFHWMDFGPLEEPKLFVGCVAYFQPFLEVACCLFSRKTFD